MVRFARVASVLAFGLLAAPVAQAQTSAAGTDQSLFYADFTAGATFGHKSSGSVGAEGGYHVADDVDVFVEGGRMANVGTQDLDNRASTIANALGATFSASQKVGYFDVGVRYHLPDHWVSRARVRSTVLHPYVAFGVGVAHVRNETVLSINGTPDVNVQYGSDLNGTLNKALVMFGGGVTAPFAKRFLVDVSYRYGRIFAKTGEIENDVGINTNRLQFGFGVRF